MYIYLPHYAGYEVRYNIEADCLEVRRLHEVTEEVGESDDGLRSGGVITRLEGFGEWRADHDFCEELLQEGRGWYAQLQAEAAAKAAEMAAKEAEFAARKPMTVEVVDGQILVDGEAINVREFLDGDIDREVTIAGRRIETPVETMLDSGLFVLAKNGDDGVMLRIGYPE